MSAGKVIPVALRTKIVLQYEAMKKTDPRVTAAEVAAIVRQGLRRTSPDSPPDWPSDSAVRKIIWKHKDDEKKAGVPRRDRPWSLLSLSVEPIAADALPMVVDVWAHSVAAGQPLTIRQARWVSRLHRLYSSHTLVWEQAKRLSLLERWVDPKDLCPARIEGSEWLWVEDYFAYNNRAGCDALNEAVHEALHRVMVKAYPVIEIDVDDEGHPIWDFVEWMRHG